MDIPKILSRIRPGARWSLNGDEYDGLDWPEQLQSKPTLAEIEDAAQSAQQAILMDALMVEFRKDRAAYTGILSSMAGMYDRAGNGPAAAACDTLTQGLLDIPQHPSVTQATTAAQLKTALENTRTALLLAIPAAYAPALMTVFKKAEP